MLSSRRTNAFAFIGALVCATASASAFEPFTVTGRVVDADGNAVTSYRVAPNWNFTEGEVNAYRELTVDESGTFSGEVESYGRPGALLAYNDDMSMAGMVMVEPEQDGPVEIKLQPAIRVTGRVISSDLGGDAGWVNTYWSFGFVRPVMATVHEGQINVTLPAGEWTYFTYGSDVKSKQGKINLTNDSAVHDLGEFDLEGTYIAMNRGRKVDDWNVTAARGVDLEASQIEDFKGQWLLVEFWGFW